MFRVAEDGSTSKENRAAGLDAEEAQKVFDSFLQKSGNKEISAVLFRKALKAVFPKLEKKRRRSGCGEKKSRYYLISC